jgi:hypothetical protein
VTVTCDWLSNKAGHCGNLLSEIKPSHHIDGICSAVGEASRLTKPSVKRNSFHSGKGETP